MHMHHSQCAPPIPLYLLTPNARNLAAGFVVAKITFVLSPGEEGGVLWKQTQLKSVEKIRGLLSFQQRLGRHWRESR